MSRLLQYSRKKLKVEDRQLVTLKLDDLSFSSSVLLQDLDLPAQINEVFVCSVNWFEPID